ncbi:hypothetical protein Y019_14095 [Alcanivorax sp. 97CO-6]|nr:hypothetical protein Y019_14095 [Alcanivorax sp. 97CO-6]
MESGMNLVQLIIVLTVIAIISWGIYRAKSISKPTEEPTEKAHAARIVDIDMPFGSMVTFMVKWSLASIPALMILALFGFAAAMVFGAMTGVRY